jgi:hypothetical protein
LLLSYSYLLVTFAFRYFELTCCHLHLHLFLHMLEDILLFFIFSYYLLGVFCFPFVLNSCARIYFALFSFLFPWSQCEWHYGGVNNKSHITIPCFQKTKNYIRCGDLERFNNLNSGWWTCQKSKIEGKRSCSLLPHFTPLSLLSTHNINSLKPTIRPMAFLLAHWQQRNKRGGDEILLLAFIKYLRSIWHRKVFFLW